MRDPRLHTLQINQFLHFIGVSPAGERHATTRSISLDMNATARQIRTVGGGIRGAAAVRAKK
ncbi:hypothetical protein [Schaalia hyovaginalis]|uniref:hypothetical protein n=1 Tax=Schaalia hyovaginalis TaxID=29316 RepID=UPI002A83A377|nr:hypothetical protein [Schaalia hyovaginalis]MDY4491639.1 hypothetical protein [Schaalia hyovaginalis]